MSVWAYCSQQRHLSSDLGLYSMSLSIFVPLLVFHLHRECGTCSLDRLKGSYGGCADMGTFAAGLSVLLFAVGDVSLVVHFLQIVRRVLTKQDECRPTFCACFPRQCIRPRPAYNLYKVRHAPLHCSEPYASDSTGKLWRLFS